MKYLPGDEVHRLGCVDFVGIVKERMPDNFVLVKWKKGAFYSDSFVDAGENFTRVTSFKITLDTAPRKKCSIN